jgi:hypothetical protein
MCFDLIEQEIEEARVSGEHNIIKVSCDVDNKEPKDSIQQYLQKLARYVPATQIPIENATMTRVLSFSLTLNASRTIRL